MDWILNWLLALFGGKTPAPVPGPVPGGLSSDLIARISQLAGTSELARVSWAGQGTAPLGYIKGMAVTFAMVYLKLKAGDSAARIMAGAVHESVENDHTDALSWYNSNFHAVGMSNDTAGADTLRHLFVLLCGLGVRESSGRYCEGRDRGAKNITADTAESGLFQMSWDIHVASPEIPKLLTTYSGGAPGYRNIFQEGVQPKPSDLEISGSGDGAHCQQLCKDSPAFAVEAAAVGLRTYGGNTGHWGPIRRKLAELRPEADALFRQVQALVDAAPIAQKRPPMELASSTPAWPRESTPGALDAFYGDPRGPDGEVSPIWMAQNLVKIVPPWKMTEEGRPVTSIIIHKKCAPSLNRILKNIWEHYGRDQSRINAVHLDQLDGTFNFRPNRNNPAKLSVHSYAAAIDLAAAYNPNGKEWRPHAGMMPIDVVKIFAKEGWAWGGQFNGTKDSMHMQASYNIHANEPLPVDEHDSNGIM